MAGFAEVEVVADGFVALAHWFVGDQNEASAEFFGFIADGFFGGGDEGGYEYAAVSGGVKPSLAFAFPLVRCIGAVHYHMFFEGIAELREIALGLQSDWRECMIQPGGKVEGQVIPAFEKIRECFADSKFIGIVFHVFEDGVKISIRHNDLIIEALFKKRSISNMIIRRV